MLSVIFTNVDLFLLLENVEGSAVMFITAGSQPCSKAALKDIQRIKSFKP